jgi:AcrR family transcriptional regulator
VLGRAQEGILRKETKLIESQKEKILECALDVFCKEGYEKARMDDIARLANITKTPLYYNFKDKEGLFDAVFRNAYDIMFMNDLEVFASSAPLYEKLLKCYVYCGINFHKMRIMRLNSILYNHPEFESTWAYRLDIFKRFRDLKGAAISAAKENGEIRLDADPERINTLVNESYYGVLYAADFWLAQGTIGEDDIGEWIEKHMIMHLELIRAQFFTEK